MVVRVPLPDRQTEVVRLPAQLLPQDVTAGMAGLADRKDREAADQRSRAADTADPTTRQGYETGAQVAAREAAGYRSACACVYAAVVRAAPAALRALAGRDGVRALDPAPEVTRLDRTVFLPPLPEQRDTARPPADTARPPADTARPPRRPGRRPARHRRARRRRPGHAAIFVGRSTRRDRPGTVADRDRIGAVGVDPRSHLPGLPSQRVVRPVAVSIVPGGCVQTGVVRIGFRS